MASIGIGFLGEPSLARLIEPIFGGLSHGVAVGISVGIAFTLVTSIHIALGEQVPKILAITRAEGTAASWPGRWRRSALSGPFTVGLTKIANGVVRLFGVRPGRAGGAAHGRGREGHHSPIGPIGHGRLAGPPRGGMLSRRLPPARAGGARGDDPDPGRGHRQRLGEGGGGVAALRLLGPHQVDRDRG